MWQSLLIGLIVCSAVAYVIWTLMPSRLRARLRVRLHLAAEPVSAHEAAVSSSGKGELPCGNCAHNTAPHVRTHR
jgi:hypothetical protein